MKNIEGQKFTGTKQYIVTVNPNNPKRSKVWIVKAIQNQLLFLFPIYA
jgi:hypothetical protein